MLRPTSVIALIWTALISTLAQAQSPIEPAAKSYIGAGLGMSSYRWNNNPAGGDNFCSASTATLIHTCEYKPIGFKVFAGYNFNDYLGVEVSYYNAGKGELTFTDTAADTLRQRVHLSGYGLSLVGTLPLGSVAYVSARAGVAAGSVLRRDDLNGVRIYKHEHTTAQPLLGLSLGAHLSRRAALRLDWDRVRGETVFEEEFEADLATLNLLYRF